MKYDSTLVKLEDIQVHSDHNKIRYSLSIPLRRNTNKTASCILLFPSVADKFNSDPTIDCVIKYIHHNVPEISLIHFYNIFPFINNEKFMENNIKAIYLALQETTHLFLGYGALKKIQYQHLISNLKKS